MVSEFEEREAAIFAGATWKEWLEMEMSDRAASIAHMRYHSLIGSHVNDVVQAQARKGK